MGIITNPQLPPLAGYVEDEDDSGNRVYRKIATEQDNLNDDYDEFVIDASYRLTLLELGVQ